MRQSWVGLAQAYQASGDLENADKVLTNYKTMLKVSFPNTTAPFETVETNLKPRTFQTMISNTRSYSYTISVLRRTSESTMTF